MKKLIVDYLPFEVKPEYINESMKENNGKLIVRGVLQRAEAKNQNGRVYPREILHREAKKYTKEFINQRRAMGELDHPDSSVVNLQNVSHNIKDMNWEGDNLLGTVEVLGTPAGNILKELFKSNIKLGISSRGMGSLKASDKGGAQVVQSDFQLATAADIVADPSAPDAFVDGVMEGVEWIWDNGVIKAQKIEEYKNSIRRAKTHKLQETKLNVFKSFLENL